MEIPTKDALSAGGVVVRMDRAAAEVIVLGRERGYVKCLPKGTVEQGESPEAAALREVREEGGVTATIVAALPTIDYWFYWRPQRTRYHKFVHFYLMRYLDGDVADHDHEVESAEWVSLADAGRLLTFPGERETVLRAVEWLEQHGDRFDPKGDDRDDRG